MKLESHHWWKGLFLKYVDNHQGQVRQIISLCGIHTWLSRVTNTWCTNTKSTHVKACTVHVLAILIDWERRARICTRVLSKRMQDRVCVWACTPVTSLSLCQHLFSLCHDCVKVLSLFSVSSPHVFLALLTTILRCRFHPVFLCLSIFFCLAFSSLSFPFRVSDSPFYFISSTFYLLHLSLFLTSPFVEGQTLIPFNVYK